GTNDLVHPHGVVGKNVVHGGLHVGGIEEGDGRVGLWVQIEKEGLFLTKGDSRSEVDGGCRFSDAAFLVGDCQNASQAIRRLLPRATAGLYVAPAGPGNTIRRQTVPKPGRSLQAKNVGK